MTCTETPADAEAEALDRHLDELVAKAPRLTSAQASWLRRLFRYGPAEAQQQQSDCGSP